MNFNMNLKYILIGLLGMNGAAVMPPSHSAGGCRTDGKRLDYSHE